MPKRNRLCSLTFIRYADDFVVLDSDRQIILKCRKLISTWLNDIGLELKPSKTRLAHTLLSEESEDGIAGFNFLGFNATKDKTFRLLEHQEFAGSSNKYVKVKGDK